MTIKVNLGVMLGGFVLLIVGVLVLLVAALWALVSFLFASSFEAPFVITIAALVLIAIGIADIAGGVRGFRHLSASSQVVDISRRRKDWLNAGQRFGEVVSAFIMLLIMGFFVYHLVNNTGFFTSTFGSLEEIAFFGSMVISFLPPLARAAIGRRNPVRPLEAGVNILFAVASIFLLSVFPFNFAHFADALPAATRFMFFWLTNDIARIAFVLAIFGSLVSAGVNIVRYLTFISREFEYRAHFHESVTRGEFSV